MNTQEIMSRLKELGKESTYNTFKNHGAPDNLFGVSVGDLKTIQKKIKKNYELSLELYNTGNSDAMYLAGLIADETKMTKKDLQLWAEKASWEMISDYTVAWIAAESRFGEELANEWIDSKSPLIASAGWSTWSNLVALRSDELLDMRLLKKLLARVQKEIHTQPDRVRYSMNGFVIAVGGYVAELTDHAKEVAKSIGKVEVYMGKTACKVPYAPDYIDKMHARGEIKKKKKARC